MASYKFTFYRYLLIDRCIGNPYKPYPSRQDILEHIQSASGQEISERQLDYDLQEMRNSEVLGFYAPIEFSRSHNGYYYTEKGYTIGKFVRLQEQDHEALDLAMQMLDAYRNIRGFAPLQQAIDKIRNGLNINRQMIDQSVDRVIIQQEEWPAQEGNNWIIPVIRLIREEKSAKMLYRKFGQEPSWYHIQPGLVKEFDNRWYLVALLLGTTTPRVFAFDRIIEINETGVVAPGSEFDFSSYFNHVYGVSVGEEPPSEIHLLFDHKAAHYLITKPLHSSQKIEMEDASGVIFSYLLIPNRELVNFILGWGQNCRVLSPLSLAEKVAAEAAGIFQSYRVKP
jgi:predicted DNA-binding transcriptional regulator YafY